MSRFKKEKNNPQGVADYKYKKYVIILSLVAVALLILSVILNVWFLSDYSSRKNSDISIENEFKMLDPVRKYIDRKDRIVDFSSLRDDLQESYSKFPNNAISIYFEYLPTGENISVNKEYAFYPASLVKIPMSMAVMKKVENGEWKLTNELVLMSGDKNSGYGELYKKPIGERFAIEELLREMLINSDNTAHAIFLRNVGMDELFKVNQHLGIEDAYTENGAIRVKDFSVFLKALYMSSYLSGEYSNILLKFLSESSEKEYLVAGIPKEVSFAHKIGIFDDDDTHIYADSGIVYIPNRPYIITVMVLGKGDNPGGDAQKIMKEISDKIYNYVATY